MGTAVRALTLLRLTGPGESGIVPSLPEPGVMILLLLGLGLLLLVRRRRHRNKTNG